jgi:hypothetical protein
MKKGITMEKFEVQFYNRFAQQTQTFYVVATSEEDALRLFWLIYPKDSYDKSCVEYVGEYYDPYFYTEEEIKAEILEKERIK